ncbi:MAG: AMP-binding protein [Rhodobacteraceae bacterium]|nr:AMP-binding protein [Paracoccaceae bacterium]
MRYPAPDPDRARAYRAAGYWGDDTIAALIASAAKVTPDHLAVRDNRGDAYSYGQLMQKSAHLAGYLQAQGISKGDVVTVCMPNWADTVVAFLAILRVGGVVNPVPVNYGRADLAYAIGKCQSRALILPDHFRNTDFRAELAGIDPQLLAECTIIMRGSGPMNGMTDWSQALMADPIVADVAVLADDPAAVLLTSGTESKSKGAVHSHNSILFGERVMAQALGAGTQDVTFMASPISHTTGFMHGVVLTLTTGGTLSLLDVFDGVVAAKQMQAHGCTWTMGATPFLAEISAAMAETDTPLPTLRYFLCGGAPIPEVLAKRATDMGIRVLSIYGSTESPPHTMVQPDDPVENAWTSDGRAFPGIELRIVDTNGQDCPTGTVGEEYSRGPNTFLGYLDDPDLTRKALDSDGWVHSGDLARMLPDGSLRISGRLKEIIVRGGENISVREVEEALMTHPSVARVAVVGVAHPRLGETGAAVIVLRPGATEPELRELTKYLINKGITKFKLPEHLHIWDDLPTNPTGKVQKFIIRQKLADHAKDKRKKTA